MTEEPPDRPPRPAERARDEPSPGRDAAAQRRRRHRRAVGGTARTEAPEPRAPKDDADTEAGWGGRPEDDDDERILREKPPHW